VVVIVLLLLIILFGIVLIVSGNMKNKTLQKKAKYTLELIKIMKRKQPLDDKKIRIMMLDDNPDEHIPDFEEYPYGFLIWDVKESVEGCFEDLIKDFESNECFTDEHIFKIFKKWFPDVIK